MTTSHDLRTTAKRDLWCATCEAWTRIAEGDDDPNDPWCAECGETYQDETAPE